ncbi:MULTISPECIES: hypothetical protein [Streptomyces]|uniref:Uncharacterized protein n=1 Tax=Streptomyces hyderabadensis TaxID=598549 RepID=A0ABP9HVL2_9ACTN|nr:hypothetical protein [Streptomyces hyderabadensis]
MLASLLPSAASLSRPATIPLGLAQHSVLMLDVELGSGHARVADAGSPGLLRLRGETVERVVFGVQLRLLAMEVPRAILRELTGHGR